MAILPVVHSSGEGSYSLGGILTPLSIHASITAAPAALVRYVGQMAPRGVWHVGSFGFGAFPGDAANPALPSLGFTEYLHAETQDALVPMLNGAPYTASSLWWRWKPGVTVDLTVTTAQLVAVEPFPAGGVHVAGLTSNTYVPADGVGHQLVTYSVPAGKSALVQLGNVSVGMGGNTGQIVIASQLDDEVIYYQIINGPIVPSGPLSFLEVNTLANQLRMNQGDGIFISAVVPSGLPTIQVLASLVVLEYPQPMW